MTRSPTRPARRIFRRHVALPGEHGAWVFLLAPLTIGLFAGGSWSSSSLYLVVAALCGFLVRHPITLAIKAYAGRRGRDVLPAAWFWSLVYASVGLLHVAGLVLRGFGYVLYLVVPAVPVLLWYLWLVSRREERRQWLMEVIASGVLALAAPAAFWIGVGGPDPAGWLLWGLAWAQSGGSIAHAYMRLSQRARCDEPATGMRWRLGRVAVTVTSSNLVVAVALGVARAVPPWIFLAYALQWAESIGGALRPATGRKPKAIGFRQAAVSTLFTIVFVIAWVR